MMDHDFDAWYVDARASLGPALAAWCGDRSLAAEALDEAFVRALERWDRVRTPVSPSGWVWQTAVNIIRRRTTRRHLEERLVRRLSVTQRDHVAGPTGDDIDLRRALLTLTDKQRTTIVLFYVGDLTTNQVAAVMGVAPGTVGATLHQARQRLRNHLDTSEVPPTPLMRPTSGELR